MNIVFMGTPDFAKESLKAITEAGYNILAVVTNPDSKSGRGMKLIPSKVKEYSIEKGFKIYQPEKVKKNEEFIQEIKGLNPDIICVVAYGKILPKEILDIPKYGCVNVHGSLLPKYRGAAPIQWSIINGDKITGITTMYMDIGMDTGDMILKEEIEIGENETTGELWEKLSIVGGKLLVKTLKKIENGTASREKQGDDFSLAPMLDKEMSKILWADKTATEIKNLVRGLNPIMGTFSYLNDKKIKFWKVDTTDTVNLAHRKIEIENKEFIPGEVVYSDTKKGLFINTKDGIIEVLEIQGENAKKMQINDYLRGNSIEIGEIFK